MPDLDWVNCANSGCNSRVLRHLAVVSIGNRLFCDRKCLTSASQGVSFTRTIRGLVGDERGGYVKQTRTIRSERVAFIGRKAGYGG